MIPDPILLEETLKDEPMPLPAGVKKVFIAALVLVGILAASLVVQDVVKPPAKPACWQHMEIGGIKSC